jgi:hypothetical protein
MSAGRGARMARTNILSLPEDPRQPGIFRQWHQR